jgi:CelD/BcsL family acetyltransferase involved in cellulose biosynthesis
MAVLEVRRLEGQAIPASSVYQVEILRDWPMAASRWRGGFAGTGFQSRQWFDAWYAAFDSVSPLIALITDTVTRSDVALVPLIHSVRGGLRQIEFADLGLTDYNAPLLGPGAPRSEADMRAMCDSLVSALRQLPDGADLLRLQKMPTELASRPNPFIALGRKGSSSLNGNLIRVGDDFEAYRGTIKKMQLPRSLRAFQRFPGARFAITGRVDEALRLLEITDAQQQARMAALGVPFSLNQGACARFYRLLVSHGIDNGYAMMSSLTCDEGVVATVLGIRRDANFIFLRISNAGQQWSHCSPSRLIVERTMAALHEDGVRDFDLSIGNYAFKRRFGAMPFPLTDVSVALGWRGIPFRMRDQLAREARRHPWLADRIARARGQIPHDRD